MARIVKAVHWTRVEGVKYEARNIIPVVQYEGNPPW